MNKERINDADLLKIFNNIVSGGIELEQKRKRLQYGNWQSGGKRKTLRRKYKRNKTRKLIA